MTPPPTGRRPGRGRVESGVDGRPLAGQEVPSEARHRQRGAQRRPPHRRAVGNVVVAPAVTGGVGRVQGVQSDGPPGPQGDRYDTPGLAEGPVLSLGIDHPGTPPEYRLTPQVRLDEAALAPADLSDHHHVGIRHDPGPVERERVVDERSAQHVAPDEDALVAEAGLRHEGIGGAQVAGGGHVGRQPGRRRDDQAGLTTGPGRWAGRRAGRSPAGRTGAGRRVGPVRRPVRGRHTPRPGCRRRRP